MCHVCTRTALRPENGLGAPEDVRCQRTPPPQRCMCDVVGVGAGRKSRVEKRSQLAYIPRVTGKKNDSWGVVIVEPLMMSSLGGRFVRKEPCVRPMKEWRCWSPPAISRRNHQKEEGRKSTSPQVTMSQRLNLICRNRLFVASPPCVC